MPITVNVAGYGQLNFPNGTSEEEIRRAIERLQNKPDEAIAKPAGSSVDPRLEAKRRQLADIAARGDVGSTTDFSQESRQASETRFRREQALSGAWGPFVALGEKAGEFAEAHPKITAALKYVAPPVGHLMDNAQAITPGTRAAMRENYDEARDDYLTKNPGGGVGRAISESAMEVMSGMAGPSVLAGPAAGAVGSRIAVSAGASPAVARLAGGLAGAVEGGAEAGIDSADLGWKQAALGAAIGTGLGLAGSAGDIRGVVKPDIPATSAIPDIEVDPRITAERTRRGKPDLMPEGQVGEIAARRAKLVDYVTARAAGVDRKTIAGMDYDAMAKIVAESHGVMPDATGVYEPTVRGWATTFREMVETGSLPVEPAIPVGVLPMRRKAPISASSDPALRQVPYAVNDDAPVGGLSIRSAPSSEALGIKALGDGEHLYVATDAAGNDVASLIARQDEDGFRVKHVFVDENQRGQAIPEQLYRRAHEDLGVYKGSTDYQGRRTPVGEKMAERLRSTVPEIFEPARAETVAISADSELAPGFNDGGMGGVGAWPVARPPGPPKVVGPTLETPRFQTNLAAQLGSDEAADYITREADKIAAQTGGPVSFDDLEEMALRSGLTAEDFLAKSPRYPWLRKEERMRLGMVVKGREEKVRELASKIATGNATPEDKAMLLHARDEYQSLMTLAIGTGSEYARALNSLKAEYRLGLSDPAIAKQRIYRKYQDQIDSNKKLFEHLALLDPEKPDDLRAFLRNVDKPRWTEFVQEYWVASILSHPATHLVNATANMVNSLVENGVVRPVRAMISPDEFVAEAPHALAGMVAGLREGMAKGWDVLRTGYVPDPSGKGFLPPRSAFERAQNRVVREIVGPVATMPLRLLAASDVVSKVANWTAEIHAQAYRLARSEGLTDAALRARTAELVGTPTAAMIEAADQFALKATFNDPASAFGQKFIQLRDEVPILGGWIAPFVKIADRLTVRGFEYTPGGFIKAGLAARRGEPTMTADLAARASIGSAILLYGATLAVDDRLTASAPVTEAEKAAFYGSGKLPWSVRIGDEWVPFIKLRPIADSLAVVAGLYEGWEKHGEAPTHERLAAAAVSVGKYMSDQSFMAGWADFTQGMMGGQGAERKLANFAARTAGGFVPYSGLMRAVSQAMDPNVRKTETIAEKIQSGLPGVSRSLPSRLDPWGEEIERPAGRMSAIVGGGSPFTPSTHAPDPVDVELGRLGTPLGFVDDKFVDPKKGIAVKLTSDEAYLYQQTAGRKTKELLTKLFANPSYQAADDDKKRDVVEMMVGAARQYGRILVLRKRYNWTGK